jgi:hypothetical protein
MTKLYTSVALAALFLAATPVAYAADDAVKASEEVTKFLDAHPDQSTSGDLKTALVHAKDTAESVKAEAKGTPTEALAVDHAEKASMHAANAEKKLEESTESKMEAEAEAGAAHAHAAAATAVLHDGKLSGENKISETTTDISKDAHTASELVNAVKSEADPEKKAKLAHMSKHHGHQAFAKLVKHVQKHQGRKHAKAAAEATDAAAK